MYTKISKQINKKNKKGFEKKLNRVFMCLSLLLIMGILFGQITLSQMNLEVQRLEKDVQSKKDQNQSLVMKINEMASLDNIQSVSEEAGLAYNNDNIRTIDK